jgi:chromosomal replication initiation ATPase DnaA
MSRELRPDSSVLYVTSEAFTHEFVEAIRLNKSGEFKKNEEFRKKYRRYLQKRNVLKLLLRN